MSLLRPHFVRVNLALGGLLLGLVPALTACEEDGKTAPATCADPPLAIYDIQAGGARGDDKNPCTTDIGHGISSIGTSSTAGTASSGTSSGGKAGSGGTATAEAGAGGAGGAQ